MRGKTKPQTKKKTVVRREPVRGRGERSRARIIESAALVLEKYGMVGFTTDRVAEEAGLAVGTIYQYFPDKMALMRAFTEKWYEDRPAGLDDVPLPESIDMIADWYRAQPGAAACLEAINSVEELREFYRSLTELETQRLAKSFSSSGRPTKTDTARARTLVTTINAVMIEATKLKKRDGDALIQCLKELIAAAPGL